MLEQITALIGSGSPQEALNQLKRLQDAPPALVPAGGAQSASTQRVQVYGTLQQWCDDQLRQILESHPELRQSYQQQWHQAAEVAYASLQESKDPQEGYQALSQFHATAIGDSLAKLLTDIQLEGELNLAAMHILENQFSGFLRCDLRDLAPEADSIAMPWHRIWQSFRDQPRMGEMIVERWRSKANPQPSEYVDIFRRQLIAAAIDPSHQDLPGLLQWAQRIDGEIQDPTARAQLQEVVGQVTEWMASRQPTTEDRFQLSQWPRWQVQLSRFSNSNDETPATRPPVNQLQSLLPYHPVIRDGRVYLNELTRIRVVDLDSGMPWPTSTVEQPLFDSQISDAAYLPLGYPLQGSPRGELTLYGGCLYARMGSPVTAWSSRSRSSVGRSMSYLIGLDLENQGRMLRGFPLRLTPPEFEDCEFEGPPIAFRQWIITTIAERDQANVRRSLAAFDRFNGRLIWRSQVLGSGTVVGSERANLIAHTRPVVAGGLVYYLSDLGTVCCLDATNGRTLWMTQYQRTGQLQTDYPRPNRFRYRNGNPCVLHQGILYCLPQDCPELIALDAMTGDLVWSTDDLEVADTTDCVGIQGNTLVLSGDRLVWLDKLNGRFIGAFPDLSTPGIVNSLAQPRGLGQACLVGERVYWPISGEILVFSADLASQSDARGPVSSLPTALERISTQARGIEGGNLLFADGWFLMVAPGRLVCLKAENRTPD
jgi:outer membrane protein assembly factor BamB